MLVRLRFLEQLPGGKVGQYSLAAILAGHCGVRARFHAHAGARIHHRDLRKMVPSAYLKVIEIMTRSNLHGASAELWIYGCICDDRNLAANQRQFEDPAGQILKTRVAGINGDRGIAQHRFRPRSSNGYISRTVEQRISDVPEIPFNLSMVNFEIGKSRFAARTPVDQPVITLDQPLVVKLHEDFGHRSREALVERKTLAAPVA
jgi:hypothetical protein